MDANIPDLKILGENLTGRHVVIREDAMADGWKDMKWRVALAVGGSGCSPTAIGASVFVQYCDGDDGVVGRGAVERFACAAEVEAYAAFRGVDA